jgi:hypothetical protein
VIIRFKSNLDQAQVAVRLRDLLPIDQADEFAFDVPPRPEGSAFPIDRVELVESRLAVSWVDMKSECDQPSNVAAHTD